MIGINGKLPFLETPPTSVVKAGTYDTTHYLLQGHWLRVRRSRKQETGSEMLSIRYTPPFFSRILFLSSSSETPIFLISVVARSNIILKQLVLQAKKEYDAEAIHRIQIYFADAHGS
jgi:mitochondrial chaperone BCS1